MDIIHICQNLSTPEIGLSLISLMIVGFAKAMADLHEEGILTPSKQDSSGNKWKNGKDSTDGEKFWGSSRWFVFLTDPWHFYNMVRHVFTSLAITIPVSHTIYDYNVNFSLCMIVHATVFHYTYHGIKD